MNNQTPIFEVAMEMAFPKEFLEEIVKKFGPEQTRSCAMSTSVGGIGPLLKERIIQQGDVGLNVIGVSLLYESVWAQAWHEWGQINLQKRDVGKTLRQCLTPTDLGFPLTFFDGQNVNVEVWSLRYGKANVYFLAAPPITNIVYPGPKDVPMGSTLNAHAWAHECRLKQSWLVGRGALTLAKRLGIQPGLVILSETPTLFAHHRLVKDELQHDLFFNNTRYIFNDHTPLEYAHPIWDSQTLEQVKLDPSNYMGKPAWNPSKKTLDITSLLVGMCDAVYGVAKKHGDVMKAMPSLKEFAPKIQYVTNGVRTEDWQAPEFANPDLSDEQLLDAKKARKAVLLEWAWRHCRLWPAWVKETLNKQVIAWTRRITPYKRLDLLVKLLKNREWRNRFMQLNMVIFVGGRIHQQDNHAQDIVYDLLDILERDTELQQRVVTIDNFNIWEAPCLYQGVDGAIMLADDTREASATGFMKAMMNGAAILATADGAVPEFVAFAGPHAPDTKVNGFNIPYVQGEPTALGLLEALETFQKASQTPAARAALMRAALSATNPVSIKRTVDDMILLYDQTLQAPLATIPA